MRVKVCVQGCACAGVCVGVKHFNQRYQLPRQAEHEKDAESVSNSVMRPGEPARAIVDGGWVAESW